MRLIFTQEGTTEVIAYVEHLVGQGKSPADAIEHAALRYGAERQSLHNLYYDIRARRGKTEYAGAP